jgi:hypothetical protein
MTLILQKLDDYHWALEDTIPVESSVSTTLSRRRIRTNSQPRKHSVVEFAAAFWDFPVPSLLCR